MPVHHTDDDIDRRHELELELWRTSPMERPEADSPTHEVANIVNKAQDAGIMYDLIERFEDDFRACVDVLELGGGQGWASCMVKVMHPHTRVTLTDLSPDAVASVNKWERVFDTKIEATAAALSDEIPVEDCSQDLVFAYAAAHHFVRHRRTLRELHRVLRPGGRVLYLHEPASPEYIYDAAYKRVNRKRPDIPEDVLRIGELGRLARELGFDYKVDHYPNPAHRGPVETVYYEILSRVPLLQRLLPCTANFRMIKR
jgi:SAM-dependent methyltransferase